MKKTLLYLATFAAAVSCDLYGGQETPKTADEPGSITISFSEVKDSSFVVNIAPAAEASYYSYLIDEDVEAAVLDSSKLYKVAYSSLAQGTVKWSAEEPSKTIKMDNLTPNTTYQVYAVAGSPMGYVGSVVVASVTTSDGVNPSIIDYDYDERDFYLQFDEPVTFVDGKSITAKFYASNRLAQEYLPYLDDSQKMGVTSAADTEVLTKGDVVKISFPTLPNGAYYALVVEDGAFIDAAGLPCKGFETVFAYDAEEEQPVPSTPFFGKVSEAAMNLKVNNPEVIKDYNAYITIDNVDKIYLSGALANKVQIKVESTNDGKKITEESVLSGAPYYGVLGAFTFAFKMNEEPGRGDYITITIPEKTFFDVYGNYNSEIVVGPLLYSYGYTMEDVIGNYSFNSTSGYASYGYGPYENQMAIAASDNEDKGNIMFTGSLSDVEVKFYADFDADLGTVSLEKGLIVGTALDYVYGSDNKPVLGDDGQPVLKEYPIALYLSNGQKLYSNQLGFDMPASHTLDFWYLGEAYIALVELDDEGNPYNFYDLLLLKSVEYIQESTTSAKALSSGHGVKPFFPISRQLADF